MNPAKCSLASESSAAMKRLKANSRLARKKIPQSEGYDLIYLPKSYIKYGESSIAETPIQAVSIVPIAVTYAGFPVNAKKASSTGIRSDSIEKRTMGMMGES